MTTRTEYKKQYYLDHKEKWKEYGANWRKKNRRKHADISKKYRAEFPEKAKASSKAYQDKNRDLILQRKRGYYLKHWDKNKAWRQANAQRLRAYKREWEAKNADREREKRRIRFARWSAKNEAKIALNRAKRKIRTNANLGDPLLVERFYESVRLKPRIKCYYCGRWTPGKLAHIHHVISLAKDGNHAIENLAASCADCNLSKGPKLPHEWPKHPQMFLTI